jgi:hypothetical protein
LKKETEAVEMLLLRKTKKDNKAHDIKPNYDALSSKKMQA